MTEGNADRDLAQRLAQHEGKIMQRASERAASPMVDKV
jgi:hypothetical protein